MDMGDPSALAVNWRAPHVFRERTPLCSDLPRERERESEGDRGRTLSEETSVPHSSPSRSPFSLLFTFSRTPYYVGEVNGPPLKLEPLAKPGHGVFLHTGHRVAVRCDRMRPHATAKQ